MEPLRGDLDVLAVYLNHVSARRMPGVKRNRAAVGQGFCDSFLSFFLARSSGRPDSRSIRRSTRTSRVNLNLRLALAGCLGNHGCRRQQQSKRNGACAIHDKIHEMAPSPDFRISGSGCFTVV
jgi:hypothetical protein